MAGFKNNYWTIVRIVLYSSVALLVFFIPDQDWSIVVLLVCLFICLFVWRMTRITNTRWNTVPYFSNNVEFIFALLQYFEDDSSNDTRFSTHNMIAIYHNNIILNYVFHSLESLDTFWWIHGALCYIIFLIFLSDGS